MRQLLRISAGVFILFVTIVAIALLVLVTLIDPNDFKDEISKQVMRSTGRPFEIQGRISWDFFPHFGVHAESIRLGNPKDTDSTDFASVEDVKFYLRLSALLFGRLSIDAVDVRGLSLYLEQYPNGKNNWSMTDDASSGRRKNALPPTNSTPTDSAALAISISTLHVRDANVYYHDGITHKDWVLRDVSLDLQNMAPGVEFPIRGELQFLLPDADGQVSFSGDVFTDFHHNRFGVEDFRINLDTARLFEERDLPHTLLDISGQYDSMMSAVTVHSLEGTLFGAPIEGEVTLNQLDDMPSGYGHFDLSRLALDTVNIDQASLDVQARDGTLQIRPIQVQAYEGQLDGSLSFVYQNQVISDWALETEWSNLAIGDFTGDIAGIDWLSGTASGQLEATGHTVEYPLLLEDMQATADMAIQDGAIKGFDIPFLFDSASARAASAHAETANQGKTVFDSFTASFQLNDGVLKNRDLTIQAPGYALQGAGTCSLADPITASLVDYEIKAKKSDSKKKDRIPLFIQIRGPLDDPQVTPNMEAYVQTLIERELRKKVGNKIGFPGVILPDSDAPTESEPPADDRTESESRHPVEELEDAVQELENVFRGGLF